MSDDIRNRRGDDRMGVAWQGTLYLEDDSAFACTVSDVSTAGTKVETDARPALGAEVILDIPRLGEFAGRVQWVRPPYFGLALQAGPDLLLKRIAEDAETYPHLGPVPPAGSNDNS